MKQRKEAAAAAVAVTVKHKCIRAKTLKLQKEKSEENEEEEEDDKGGYKQISKLKGAFKTYNIYGKIDEEGGENLRNGFGKQEYNDKSMYWGMFKKGKAHEWRKFNYSEGDFYQGRFLNDKANGYGEYFRVNRSKYIDMEKNIGWAFLYGKIKLFIKGSGKMILLMDTGFINLAMRGYI